MSSATNTSASASTPRTYAAAISSKPSSSLAIAFSPTQAPSKGSFSQASASSSVPITANNNGNGTTITSPPASFSTLTASNPSWTSDTTTVIHGTVIPVLYLGKHKGIELKGLGGKPGDPVRPGCSGLFRSIIGCGTWIKLPGLPTFEISPDGVPIPQVPPTDPDDPDDPDDQNQSAEITTHAHEKTSLKSEEHIPSATSQSRIKISSSAGSSSSARSPSSARSSFSQSTSHTVAYTESSARHSKSWTTASRSTAIHSNSASASATATRYIIRLQPAISATQLEGMIDDVKAHASNMYSIPLGSRPNDTVICAQLNSSSFAQFEDDPLVSS